MLERNGQPLKTRAFIIANPGCTAKQLGAHFPEYNYNIHQFRHLNNDVIECVRFTCEKTGKQRWGYYYRGKRRDLKNAA